jgi:anaerobic magnesium-protoporphyrin IX monomethyl ester cyclase
MSREFHVALINPPYGTWRYSRSQRSPGVIKSGTMYYPYWLAHAGAVLDKEGFDVWLYDCPAAGVDLESLLASLEKRRPKLCILDSSTASSANDLRVAQAIKKRFPEIRICMVGTHVTALWQETLQKEPAVDFVAIGEFDYIVLDLARALEKGERTETIPALGFRMKDGTPARGPVRTPIEDVDALPWIAPIYHRFLDPKNYYFSLASYPMVMLIGGRGCVAKCTYCVYPQVMHGHRYRTRSPASVVGEMKWIQDHMPEIEEIVFEDDTFTGDREYAREVARLVKEQGVRLKWFANVRTNVDRETLAAMKEAGFRCCATGFESGDDILLKNMWKGQTVEQQKRFVKDCKDLGILVHGCFMFGFPGESYETMEKTLKLAMYLDPDSAQFYPVMPFPGTTYYIWAKEHGYLATDKFNEWVNDEGGHRCVLNLPGLDAKAIEEFCEKAYMRFFFRPKYIWFKMKQAVSFPMEGLRSIKSFIFFIGYLLVGKKARKREQRFQVPGIEVPKDWYSVQRMPKGRMFEQATRVSEVGQTPEALAELAKKASGL